jgi:signal transduction histidine kinase
MNRRILIVDDNQDIHGDFDKILGARGGDDAFRSARSAFLGGGDEPAAGPDTVSFDLAHGFQGEEGLRLLRDALAQGAPFAVAFVDVRMPPGWDGIQTINRLWEEDADLQVVICTAYADYSFEEIVTQLGSSDRLLILKKPFDPVEVRQLAVALTEKWNLIRRDRARLEELRKAEAETREYAAALEQSNRALAEATRQAQAANKAKSEFLANMSHEIRTPMTGILGYGELICDPSVPLEDRLRYGEIIRRSGDHLLTVLNDILDISRIESGRMELNAREVEIAAVVRDVSDLIRPQAEEKGLSFGVEWAEPVPRMLELDPQRLRQVLLNLLGNAVKFTEQGAVRLRIGTCGDRADSCVCFDVIDTGVGIRAEDMDDLFEAFTQGDTSLTREVGGTGLGLAISKRLALMLGGSIEVESQPGKGSTFTLRLNVGDLDRYELVQPDRAGTCAEGGAARAPDVTLDGRLLLVEDGAVNQLLISTVLRNAGAHVDVASEGREGCRKVRAAIADGEPYELILMDMQMPVMDGYDAAATLRREGLTTPIVALTAHAMTGDRERCIEAGCTDYATKPIDRVVLLGLCRRLIELERAGAPMPAPSGSPEQRDGERDESSARDHDAA